MNTLITYSPWIVLVLVFAGVVCAFVFDAEYSAEQQAIEDARDQAEIDAYVLQSRKVQINRVRAYPLTGETK